MSRQRGAFHWTVSVGVAKSERGKKEGGVSGSVGVVSVLWVWLDRVRFHWMVILGVAYAVGGVRQRIASAGRVSGRGFVVARQVEFHWARTLGMASMAMQLGRISGRDQWAWLR